MPESSPAVPPQSNGGLIATGIILLLGAGGLVFWKMQSKGSEPEVVEQVVPAATASAPVAFDNAPPPPPEEEEEPKVEEQPKAAGPSVGAKPSGPAGCVAECAGSVTPALQSALAARGAMARSCYMTALRVNPTLEGKMTMTVKVSPQGAVCSAGVSSNSLGDQAVASCAAAKFRAAPFPPPQGGCVTVNVPLNFTAKQ